MSYRLRTYAEFRNGLLGTEIQDLAVTEGVFSINIIGNGINNFSQTLSENALWMCSNFYDSTEPLNSIEGQTWFDTSTGELKVKDNTNAWKVVTSNIIDTDNINYDLLPAVTDTYNVGSSAFKYSNLYVSRINADRVIMNNTIVGTVVIDENGNSAVKKFDTEYPSILNNNAINEDIDALIDNVSNGNTTPWATTYEVIEIDSPDMILGDIVGRTEKIFNMTSVPVDETDFIFNDVAFTEDAQVVITTEAGFTMNIILPSIYSYNFIVGNPSDLAAISSGGTVKVSLLKTLDASVKDIIVSR